MLLACERENWQQRVVVRQIALRGFSRLRSSCATTFLVAGHRATKLLALMVLGTRVQGLVVDRRATRALVDRRLVSDRACGAADRACGAAGCQEARVCTAAAGQHVRP